MMAAPRGVVLAIALAMLLASCAHPATQQDGPVTERNLLASERFWPYRVALTEPWPVASAAPPIPRGMTGVLIRVEPSGIPRIDFGHGGKHEIPVRSTDLLERANRIRTGELEKTEPNFVHAIKSRMLDAASDTLRPLPLEESEHRRGFLCVFADPAAEDFAELAAALAPFRERSDVLTILFPQGKHPDAATRERLRSLEWPVPFLYDFLAEPYTRTLLTEGTPLPALLLQTNEGRLIFQSRWTPDTMPALLSVWNEAFGEPPTSKRSSVRSEPQASEGGPLHGLGRFPNAHRVVTRTPHFTNLSRKGRGFFTAWH